MGERDTTYVPATAPPVDSIEALAAYLQEELQQVSRAIQNGDFIIMRLTPWGTLPPRPRAGDMAYFLEDAGQPAPAAEGLYMWDREPAPGRWEPVKVLQP